MERNWLIRTGQNQILGPVTKNKVKDLLNSGSLELEDEVCSGNGYWFKIKEEELVEKYIHGDYIQGHNPVSEAKSVLTSASGKKVIWPVVFFLVMSFSFFHDVDNIKAQEFAPTIGKKKV